MHESVTTALDITALLAVAAGVYFAAAPWIGAAGLIPAGLVLGGVSAWWASRPKGGAK